MLQTPLHRDEPGRCLASQEAVCPGLRSGPLLRLGRARPSTCSPRRPAPPRPARPSLLCGSEAGGARLCGRPPLCLLCVCFLFGMELVSQLWRAGRQTGLPFLFCFVFLRRAIFSPLETILGLGGYNSGFHVERHIRPPWLRGCLNPGGGGDGRGQFAHGDGPRSGGRGERAEWDCNGVQPV